MNKSDLDAAKNRVLTENTAQSILKWLNSIAEHRRAATKRWPWEMLQNALDASQPGGVSCRFRLEGSAVSFSHDGRPFQLEELAHLIFHGSTKAESDESVGQFGTGFLTVHAFSRDVLVTVPIVDGESARFTLSRKGESSSELSNSLSQSYEELGRSLTKGSGVSESSFEFTVDDQDREDVDSLLCDVANRATVVMALNDSLKSISIESNGSSLRATRGEAEVLENGTQIIRFQRVVDGSRTDAAVALTESDSVRVASVLRRTDDQGWEVESVPGDGLIHIGLPLDLTRGLFGSAHVHSLSFFPQETRQGLLLANGQRSEQNYETLEEVVAVLESHWGTLQRTGVERTEVGRWMSAKCQFDWLDNERFRPWVSRILGDRLEKQAVVQSVCGVFPLCDLIVPYSSSKSINSRLWAVARQIPNIQDKLPVGLDDEDWRLVCASWLEVDSRNWIVEAEKLSALISAEVADLSSKDSNWPSQNVEILDELCAVLIESGVESALEEEALLVTEAGTLEKLHKLRGAQGISDDWFVLDRLLESGQRERIVSRSHEKVSRVKKLVTIDLPEFMENLIHRSTHLAAEDQPLEGDAAEGMLRLTAMLLGGGHSELLSQVPLVVGDVPRRCIRDVVQGEPGRAVLAPVALWPSGLQPFHEIYREEDMVSSSYTNLGIGIESLRKFFSGRGVWLSPIHRANEVSISSLSKPLGMADPTVEHSMEGTKNCVWIARLTGEPSILRSTRRNRQKACSFVRFLIAAIEEEDVDIGLSEVLADCSCGQKHLLTEAEWIDAVIGNQWIPDADDKTQVLSIESLIELYEGSTYVLPTTREALALFSALGLDPVTLCLRLSISEDVDLADLAPDIASVLGQLPLSSAGLRSLSDALRDAPDAIAQLHDSAERARSVRENRRVGELVEHILMEILSIDGWDVRDVVKGADMEVSGANSNIYDDDDSEAVMLDLWHDDLKVAIEVKSTRVDAVRMTMAQARRAAANPGSYYLCIVNLDGEPTESHVRETAQFSGQVGLWASELLRSLDVAREDALDGMSSGEMTLEVGRETPRFRVSAATKLGALGLDAFRLELSERLG
jgi:hypothetical protein